MTTTTLNPRSLPSLTSNRPVVAAAPVHAASVKADLEHVAAQLISARRQLAEHREVMARTLYTPDGYKVAQAKLDALTTLVAQLESRDRVLSAELAGTPVGLTVQDGPQLTVEKNMLQQRVEQLQRTIARSLMTPEQLARAQGEIAACRARTALVERFVAARVGTPMSGASVFE